MNAFSGGIQNPFAGATGAYLTAYAMGGDNRNQNARRAAWESFQGGTLSNATQLTYNYIKGPPQNGTYQFGRRLNEQGSGLMRVLNSAGSVFGFAHSGYANIIDGKATTYELFATRTGEGLHGVAGMVPPGHKDNSYDNFGNRFGTWWQPVDAIPSRPIGDVGPYNLCTGSCNNWTW